MRIPGWLLVAGSLVAVLLLGARVYVAHAVGEQRLALAQDRQVIADGPSYEHMWKQLAAGIYESGHNDAALQALLKRHQIDVQVKAPPSATTSSAPPAAASTP